MNDMGLPETQTEEFNVSPIITPQEEPFEVDTSPATTAPSSSPETLNKRSFKVKYGLDEVLKKTRDEIFAELVQGNEPALREQAAAEVDKRKALALDKLIEETAKNKGSALTVAEASSLKTIVTNMSQNTDPDTVFETAYGKKFISTIEDLAVNKPDSIVTEAKQKYPEETAKIFNEHSSLIAKQSIIETELENAQDEAKAQGWIGWGYDQMKYMIPGYTDVQMRGNIPGPGVFAGGTLSENLEAQRIALLRMPPSEMKVELQRIKSQMLPSNPSLWLDFLNSMKGMSYTDAVLKNVTLPLDLAGLGIGKAAVKGTRRLLKLDTQILKDTEKAAQDMVKGAADPDVSKSSIEAHAGDLEQSAVTRATTNFVGDAKGLPDATRRGLEALSDVHRVDVNDIKARPGRFGAEIVNRIEEQYNDIVGSVMDVVRKISKVERLPEVMANEVSVRAIIDNMKDKYRELRNAVIDTSRPYKENVANTWHVDFHVGNNDGTYFSQRSVAENFIKFHGLKSAEIKEGTNVSDTKAGRKVTQTGNQLTLAKDTVKKIEARLKDDKYSTPEKRAKDEETLAFLKDEAIPSYTKKLEVDTAKLNATVEQQGMGFYIKLTKPIAETDDIVRDVIANTTNTKIPNNSISSFFNAWGIGKYRTPEDTLSKAERQNRLIATYTPSEIFNVLAKNSPNTQRLADQAARHGNRFSKAGKKWEEFQRVLENGQELWDTETKLKGYFFKSPAELEEAYVSWFKRLPEQDEIAAYFEFKRAMEIDRAFRNIAEHRNQSRVGAETHKAITVNEKGESIHTPEFSGVVRNRFGGSVDNVAILGEKYGFEKVRNLGSIPLKEKNEIQELIDNGTFKLIEIYNPELRPLKGYGNIGDDRVRYLLARTTETRDLDWQHINRRGGGHVEYDHAYYIKQANIKEDKVSGHRWYEGDTTIMPMQLHAMAKDVAAHLDKVRQLIKAKDEAGARDYSNKNLHVEWKTVESWFKGTKNPNGTWTGAQLNLNEPIQVVNRGEAIVDIDRTIIDRNGGDKVFRNGKKEGSLARQNRVEFSDERDANDVFTLENKGTRGNPLYAMMQAEKVDPITSLNRGLTRIAKSNFMDDYKTMSVEHWLQQAKGILQATESEIRHSPFYYFKEAQFLPNADPILKAQLETAKAHINQLVMQPSDTANKLHIMAQRLSDGLYNKLGPNSVLTPEWELEKLRDPFKYIRSVVYHAKMGLFNIPQFIVQAGNYSNILGIAGPKYASSGTLGAQLHFWSRANSSPEIVDFLDKMASKFHVPGMSRWKPGEFKEAFEEFKKTGFGNVGGEYAALDDPMNQKVITHAGNTFLDWSTVFVRNGERNARYGAWYTAYREFRDIKPTGRITETDRANILQRADLLNINMSRASSSALHTGAMSIPTQFYTYQIRLTELFTGGRLTEKERLRLFTTNSLLYGLPMGLGLTGIPMSGWLREEMAKNGYVVGDNFFESAATEGLLSALGAVITGKGDPQAGTWYDFAERFGTKGFEFLGGINRSDKNFLDIITGPAGSLMKGTIEQSDGFWRVMMNLVKDDNEFFPPTAEDLIDPLKEVSSVNSFFRTLAAFNTHRWISKKEAWLADVTPFQAVFSGLTSLKDQRINDIQSFRNASKHQKEYEAYVEKQFMQEFRRFVIAEQDDDHTNGKKFLIRARRWLDIGGYPEDRISELVNKASRDNLSILDKVTFDFYKKLPNQQKDTGMDALKRSERVKQKQSE